MQRVGEIHVLFRSLERVLSDARRFERDRRRPNAGEQRVPNLPPLQPKEGAQNRLGLEEDRRADEN